MKALVYEGVEALSFGDRADPTPAEGEALVRIDAVGICGSDMHAYLGHDARRPAPLILGHEAAGVVHGGAWDGKRVTINPLVTCGECRACKTGRENLCPHREILSMPPREGTFAEWAVVPTRNLVEVPYGVPLTKAALAEPLAVSWHACKLALAGLHPSMHDKALVLGGGAIGFGAALSLEAMGISDITIVEPNPLRRAFLSDVSNYTLVETADGAFPVVIDAVGYEATRAVASALTEPGGVIAHVGLGSDTGGLDIRRLTLQEITFIGTYTYSMQDFRDAAQAIFDGKFGALDWMQERPLSDGQNAFQDILKGQVLNPKIILRP